MIHSIFPTDVLVERVDHLLQREIVQEFDQLAVTYFKHPDQHDITTEDYRDDILDRMPILDNEINRRLEKYVNYLGFDPATVINRTSWAVRYAQNERTLCHDHGIADLSIAYYLQLPARSAGIYFEDPTAQHTRLLTHQRGNQFMIEPEQGDIVVFPSWLKHGSMPNPSEEYRIVISANYWFDRTHLIPSRTQETTEDFPAWMMAGGESVTNF